MCAGCGRGGWAYTWEDDHRAVRDIRKARLTLNEVARLESVRKAFARGEAGVLDHKVLRKGIEELRVDGENRILRLYFGRREETSVLVAVHVQVKKKNNDRAAVDLAITRWNEQS